MSDDENRKTRVTAEVSEQTHELAKANTEYGGISAAIRDKLEQLAHPDDVDNREDIINRLRELRNKRDEIRLHRDKKKAELERVIDEDNREIDSLETKIARLEERKDDADSKQAEFEGHISQLIAHVEDGGHIFPGYNGVKEAARASGKSPEFVIETVKERTDLPDSRFEAGTKGMKTVPSSSR